MICGTTMQAAISTVAHSAERVVDDAAHERQHRGVGQMEQQRAARENQQRRLADDGAHVDRRVIGFLRHRSAMRAIGIDLGGADAAERNQRRDQQHRGDEEHRTRRQQVSDGAHHGGCDPVADGGKARIASKPLADGRMTDEPEAHRDDAGSEHAARGRVQAAAASTTGKIGRRIGERGDGDRGQRQPGDEPLRARRVDQRAARHLPDQRDQPPTDSTRPMSICVHFCEVR